MAADWGSWNQPGRSPRPLTPQAQPAAPAMDPWGPGSTGSFIPGQGRAPGSYNPLNPGTSGRGASGWTGDSIRNRWSDAQSRTGVIAGQAEDAYLDRATNFNAQDSVNRAAGGAFNQFRKKLGQDIGDLRGEQVGMGRLDTGFATEDEDRLVTSGIEGLTDQVAGYAMQGAQLQQQNDQGIGEFGQEYGNRYLDLMAGQYDRATADKNAKKKKGFWGTVGDVAKIAAPLI